MGVNKLYNAYEAGKQIVKTVKSPITHARNLIKSTFTKNKKPKIGGTAKSDRIKDINKMDKKAKKIIKKEEATINLAKTDKNINRKDLVPRAKNLRDTKRIQREIKQFAKDTLKSSFKKGGRAGFEGGGSTNGNGKKGGLGMQSVIHGLDKNPNVTAADPKAKFIAAAKSDKPTKPMGKSTVKSKKEKNKRII
jgi:hypothetical protein